MAGYVLLYDGQCQFCTRSVARLKRRDRLGRLEFLPSQDPQAPRRFPQVTPEQCAQAMQLIDPRGQVSQGADALVRILWLLPGGPLVAWLYAVPGVPFLARYLYRWVAKNRYRLGCQGRSCQVKQPN
ncbi:MAG: DUF393 domain-containing protein [Deinococcus sp.]|nr:DUF393 domain-containing protein [Deinococcus sp.]